MSELTAVLLILTVLVNGVTVYYIRKARYWNKETERIQAEHYALLHHRPVATSLDAADLTIKDLEDMGFVVSDDA